MTEVEGWKYGEETVRGKKYIFFGGRVHHFGRTLISDIAALSLDYSESFNFQHFTCFKT